MDSLRGQLLIATPALQDPNFARTVVLVGEHTEEGALGVVLNRPSDTPVAEAVPDLADLVEVASPVHVGGPVQPSAVLVLAEFDGPGDGRQLITEEVGFVSIEDDGHAEVAAAALRARVYAGYAGWGPGQLEDELERDDWIVTTCRAEDVFTDDADALWSRVLDRMGGRYRLVARMPADPSMN
jgi:putative transcriptional regulator